MSHDLTDDDESTLVQVMAWHQQATSHYLSQCWPRSLLPYGYNKFMNLHVMNCLKQHQNLFEFSLKFLSTEMRLVLKILPQRRKGPLGTIKSIHHRCRWPGNWHCKEPRHQQPWYQPGPPRNIWTPSANRVNSAAAICDPIATCAGYIQQGITRNYSCDVVMLTKNYINNATSYYNRSPKLIEPETLLQRKGWIIIDRLCQQIWEYPGHIKIRPLWFRSKTPYQDIGILNRLVIDRKKSSLIPTICHVSQRN